MQTRNNFGARLVALAAKQRMERAGEDVEKDEDESAVEGDEAEGGEGEEKPEAKEEPVAEPGVADTVFGQMKLIVDKRVMPIVEPALKKLADELAKNMKTGSYDEITKAVQKVRKDLENINQACETIYKYVDKLNK